MQVNQPKGGTGEATTNPLAIGDRVSYVQLTAVGRGYRVSARNGVITEIDGQVATVRGGDGRHITKPLAKLIPEGQPNALTRMLAGEQ